MTTQLEISAKLAEIGAQLKQMRETKALTLEEVQASTLIPKNHLQAIEEGNLDRLPELVYVQGFIRKYSKAIGMVEIASELPEIVAPSPAIKARPELTRWHLYGLYFALVSISLTILAFLLREPYRQESIPAVPEQTPVKQETSQVTAVSELSDSSAVKVGVEMLAESWMRVIVDGKLDFEGIMPEGTTKEWSGQKEIVLRTGNAAAVKLTFNQNPPKTLGNEGEVVELVFDRNTVTTQP